VETLEVYDNGRKAFGVWQIGQANKVVREKKRYVRVWQSTTLCRNRELLTKSNRKKRSVYRNVLRQMEQW
jgi:hypothetical protein